MKVVVQRVTSSSVKVEGKTVGSIDKGLLVLVGFTHDDNIDKIKWMVNKIVNLRIFDDEEGVMNKSVSDIGGSVLSVSQFTLYADANKGNRPSYINAMKQEDASSYYDIFNEEVSKMPSSSLANQLTQRAGKYLTTRSPYDYFYVGKKRINSSIQKVKTK